MGQTRLMVKLLLGIYTDEGGVVKFSTPNFTKKEANQLLDNVLFSANIYGQSSTSKKDIAFTLPIMYLPGYTHGRIYFKFSPKNNERFVDPLVITVLTQPTSNFPISFFCAFEKLNEDLNPEILSDIDLMVWNFLRSEMEEENFQKLASKIDDYISKIA